MFGVGSGAGSCVGCDESDMIVSKVTLKEKVSKVIDK